MRNRDDLHHHRHSQPEPPELESALVRRLQEMEWPKPPPGVRERCLTRLLAHMESMESSSTPPQRAAQQGGRFQLEQSSRPGGVEERHWATRLPPPSHRAPIKFAERPPRLATVL